MEVRILGRVIFPATSPKNRQVARVKKLTCAPIAQAPAKCAARLFLRHFIYTHFQIKLSLVNS